MIRWMAVATVAALAVVPAFAQDLVGEWDMKMDYQGNLIDSKMIVTKGADGALSGVWTGRRGDSELQNLAVDGNKVSFTRTVDVQGQQFDITFNGTIEGDTIAGAFETAMGTMDVTGARAGAAPAAPAESGPAIVGTWDVTSESQLGTLKRTLIVKPDLSGVYKSDEAEWPISNLAQTGNAVTFNVTVSAQGQELPLNFEGAIDGDTLKGEFTSELGNGVVNATRIGGAGGGALAGFVEEYLGVLKSQDIEGLMAYYADDFSADGSGKPELEAFLVGAKDQGMLEDMGANTDNLKVTEDGDKATVEGVEIEGAFGVLTLGFELAKRDGKWLIVSQSQQ